MRSVRWPISPSLGRGERDVSTEGHGGGGNIALRARVNNMYVVAENAGAAALIANRAAIGPWEKFELINL
jgi:hypothetical protein